MSDQLKGFLDGDEPAEAEPDARPEPAAAADRADRAAAAEPAAPPQPKAEDPKAPPEPDHTEDPPDVTGLRTALQAERAKRNDYKGERDRLRGEMDALRAQLEAANRPPPAPPPQPEQRTEQPVPNPIEDPQGYHAWHERALFNERCNMSEAMLRDQHDAAEIDAAIDLFKKAAAASPQLRTELARQPHPYRWAFEQAKKIMAMDEIGGDPAAYRSKVEAEIRARMEAEYAGTAPRPTAPRVTLPQSLGTARSAAPRTMTVGNIPETFDEILRSARK